MPGTWDLRAEATDRRAPLESGPESTHRSDPYGSGEVVVGLFPGAVVARVKVVMVGEDS
jgi:hypothetical protein